MPQVILCCIVSDILHVKCASLLDFVVHDCVMVTYPIGVHILSGKAVWIVSQDLGHCLLDTSQWKMCNTEVIVFNIGHIMLF